MSYELDLRKLLSDREKTIWDNPVPIAKSGKVYNCYISDDIGEPSSYDELCYLLESATAGETVVLHLNTNGGYIDSAFKIVASMKRSKAKVVGRCTGTVASAGTIIALCCDDLEVEDFTSFMVHNYSGGTQGKGHEIVDYINFSDKSLKSTFKAIYKTFLTDKELTEIIKGKDMWLDAEQTRERWARVKPTIPKKVTKKVTKK
jgi:ATP-dependent protease ClpP protease subunit